MNELIMTINVITYEAQELEKQSSRVVMIPFSAKAIGSYFNGKTVANGTDTQILKDGHFSLSARYMLEGTDLNNNKCKLYIENNGTNLDNCRPKIYTDSEALAFLENAELTANVECVENGCIVRIFI